MKRCPSRTTASDALLTLVMSTHVRVTQPMCRVTVTLLLLCIGTTNTLTTKKISHFTVMPSNETAIRGFAVRMGVA